MNICQTLPSFKSILFRCLSQDVGAKLWHGAKNATKGSAACPLELWSDRHQRSLISTNFGILGTDWEERKTGENGKSSKITEILLPTEMTVAEKRWNTTTRPNIDAWCSFFQDTEEYEKYLEKNRNPRGHWPIEGVRAFKDICLAVSYEGLGGRRCFCSWQQGLAGSREVIPPHQHPTQARGKGQRTLARVSTTEPGPSDSFSEMPPCPLQQAPCRECPSLGR